MVGPSKEQLMPRNPQESADLKVQPLVDTVVGDPKSPRRSMLLRGYVGSSSSEDLVRVYFDVRFSSYAEVNKKDILAAETLETPGTPLRTTYIWLAQGSEIKWPARSPRTSLPAWPTEFCPIASYNVPCRPWPWAAYPAITSTCPPLTEA